jgi:hypothetical protein
MIVCALEFKMGEYTLLLNYNQERTSNRKTKIVTNTSRNCPGQHRPGKLL